MSASVADVLDPLQPCSPASRACPTSFRPSVHGQSGSPRAKSRLEKFRKSSGFDSLAKDATGRLRRAPLAPASALFSEESGSSRRSRTDAAGRTEPDLSRRSPQDEAGSAPAFPSAPAHACYGEAEREAGFQVPGTKEMRTPRRQNDTTMCSSSCPLDSSRRTHLHALATTSAPRCPAAHGPQHRHSKALLCALCAFVVFTATAPDRLRIAPIPPHLFLFRSIE
jgi:hypothetical protein